jgi:GNAT superfamily N-acetyltransferase
MTSVLDEFTRVPLAEVRSAESAAAMNDAFAGYVVPFQMTPESFEQRFRGENIDPFASSIYRRGSATVGLLLIARRGWTARVAAMAIAPPYRRLGVGHAALTEAIDEAKKRGDRRIVLEAIEANHAARTFYERLGFRVTRRLIGFEHAEPLAPQEGAPPPIAEVDPADVAAIIAKRDEALEWPWQLAAPTLAAFGPPCTAYRLQDAFAICGDPARPTLRLIALYVEPNRRRRGLGSALLGALELRYPARPWQVPAIVPEGLADAFFKRVGWRKAQLAQVEMAQTIGE